jgi:hypothetical protein
MRFGDLKTGDVVNLLNQKAVILAIEKPHPNSQNFWMIVWWLFEEKRLSFDMLHPEHALIPGTRVWQDGFLSFNLALNEIPR